VVEDALETLPQGLPHTYVRIMERIEEHTPYMKNLALNCLAWVVYACRPLSTSELQYALATNAKCRIRQDLQPDSLQVILEACANLLKEANNVVRPIHYTVQEFLTSAAQGLSQQTIRAQLLDSNAMNEHLGSTCLTHIHLLAFSSPVTDEEDLE
jgi:hypothetical protein